MSAELLSYSRNKGLFAGIDLDGTSVSQNTDDTEIYFGQAHSFKSILKGNVAVPSGCGAVCARCGAALCGSQEPQIAKRRRGYTDPLPFGTLTMRETIEYWLVLAVARSLGADAARAGASGCRRACLFGLLRAGPAAPRGRAQPGTGAAGTLREAAQARFCAASIAIWAGSWSSSAA